MPRKSKKQTTKPVAQVTETSTITDPTNPAPTWTEVETGTDPATDVQPGPTPVPEPPEETAQQPDPMAAIRARAMELAAQPTRAMGKDCACGCGGRTKGGDWLPGHNGMALKRELERIRQAQATEQPKVMVA